MAVTRPKSWDDPGLDWDNPKPCDARYWYALVLALDERAALAGVATSGDRPRVMRGRIPSPDACREILEYIGRVAGSYIDVTSTMETIDRRYSEFVANGMPESNFSVHFNSSDLAPEYWSLSSLARAVGHDLLRIPSRGSFWTMADLAADSAAVAWLVAAKKAIDLMHATVMSPRATSGGAVPWWTTSTKYKYLAVSARWGGSGYDSRQKLISAIDEYPDDDVGGGERTGVGFVVDVSIDYARCMKKRSYYDVYGNFLAVHTGGTVREYVEVGDREEDRIDIRDKAALRDRGVTEADSFYGVYNARTLTVTSVRIPPVKRSVSAVVRLAVAVTPSATKRGDMFSLDPESFSGEFVPVDRPGVTWDFASAEVTVPAGTVAADLDLTVGAFPPTATVLPNPGDYGVEEEAGCRYWVLGWLDFAVEGGLRFCTHAEPEDPEEPS